MLAKEIQLHFIKNYLKPTLKLWGYKTTGQTWWKDKGEFYIIIKLQNFSWNSKNSVDFCFNIGVGVKAASIVKSPTAYNLDVYLREGFYLPNEREENLYRNSTGYILVDDIDENNFIHELKIDFEQYILPYLESLQTIKDCLDKYGNVTFWGDNLKKAISKNNIIL
ncbi:hypothetical protein GCM10027049_15730 [Mucilaginibacter puniceus]